MGLDAKRDFLAVGDGVADDTVALQSALTQLQIRGQTGKPATLYIPPGTYKISDGLVCKTKQFIHIIADNATIVPSGNFANKSVLNISGCTYSRFDGLHISSLLTGGNRPDALLVYGRDLNGTGGDIHIMDCHYSGDCVRATAILCQGDTSTFDRSLFNTTGSSPAIEISSGNDSGLLDWNSSTHTLNRFSSCWISGSICTDLVTIRGLVQNIRFDSCFFSPINSRVFALYDSQTTISNYVYSFSLVNCEYEGSGESARLLYVNNSKGIVGLHISTNNWSGDADYLIEVDSLLAGYGIADMTITEQIGLSNPNKKLLLVKSGIVTRSSIICQSGDIDINASGEINQTTIRCLHGQSAIGINDGTMADVYILDGSPARYVTP